MGLEKRIKATPRYSDAKILNSLFSPSEIKREFMTWRTNRSHNSFRFLILLFEKSLNLFMECGSLSLRVFSRINWGRGSLGLIIIFTTVLWMAFLSSEVSLASWWHFLKSIWSILKGITSGYDVPWKSLYHEWNTGSIPMMVHFLLFIPIALTQFIRMNLKGKWRDTENPGQKGTSLLYFVFKDRVRLDARFYNTFMEPAIWTLFTILSYEIFPTGIYKFFLTWATFSLLYQEIRDYLAQNAIKNV